MKTLVMCELPGPCNFNCEYCYVPDEVKSTPIKKTSTNDWIALASKFEEPFFWFCGAGEPTLREDVFEAAINLSMYHHVGIVTNLATEKAHELLAISAHYKHKLSIYWSIHWLEMQKKGVLFDTLYQVVERSGYIWPTMVMYPTYIDIMPEVLMAMDWLDLKLIPTRYRVDQGPLANIDYTEIEKRLRDSEHTDMRLWDATPDCWDVKGGICSAGLNQVIVDYQYNICTCHGNGNKKVWGKFPEDIDKVKPEATGICYSDKCPCKHSVMWGINSKFDYTFGSILVGWDSYVG
jgi:hypothetical protein